MKFLHLSDLHIGKTLNGISLLEDQKYILNEILLIIDKYCADAVLVAGDVYDTKTPQPDAVRLLDWFFTEISSRNKPLFVISGNHDSPERLMFGSDIFKQSRLYISGNITDGLRKVQLSDKFGNINIFMLPFIKPVDVRHLYEDNTIQTFEQAVNAVICKTTVNENERNIIMAHQFITASGTLPERSESETIYVGGVENVDYSAFYAFDYVALGHLHCPQSVGRDTVVYGGSPIKYSVSERFQNKFAILVELCGKNDTLIEKIRLEPLRDLRQIKGELENLLNQRSSGDFVSVILTDKQRHFEPMKRLRAVYKNCLSIEYEYEQRNAETTDQMTASGDLSTKMPIEIVDDFFFDRNGEYLDKVERSFIAKVLEEAGDVR